MKTALPPMGVHFSTPVRADITMPTRMNHTNDFVPKSALENEFPGDIFLAFSFGFR
jgi:hypothetical protein